MSPSRLALLSGLVTLSATIPAMASDLTVIAVTNQPASGGPAGARFGRFGNFFGAYDTSINSSGAMAIQGEMSQGFGGVTANDNQAIWYGVDGQLTILVREGDQAPSTNTGAVFGSFGSTVVVNDQGQVVFDGGLRHGVGGVDGNNSSGLWLADAHGVRKIAREADQAPGEPTGVVFSSFANATDHHRFNDNGQSAFYANLRDDSGNGLVDLDSNSSYWLDTNGGLQLLAREGSQAPGLPAGAVFTDLSSNGLTGTLNNNGHVAFRAFLRQGAGGVTSINDAALWTTLGGSVSLLLREGDTAPGVGAGAQFESFGEPPRLNSAGHLLISGFLRQGFGGVTAASDQGLWSTRDGALSLIVREGDQPPGAPVGARFRNFNSHVMNDSNQIAFHAEMLLNFGGVAEDNNTGIWLEGEQGLRLIAREGSQAPGVPEGAVFNSTSGRALLNANGQVAFSGSLRLGEGGVSETNDQGIWATDSSGDLRLIVREGDSVEVAPGVFRTITELRFFNDTGNADGLRTPFSDNGEIAFWARLNSNDGIFVSKLVAVEVLPGDFNDDGLVDAADYTVWRDNLGGNASVLNGNGSGSTTVIQADYNLWRSNFGASGASSDVSVVPEPSAVTFLLLSILITPGFRPRALRRFT